MPRSAITILLLPLLVALSTAGVWATPAACATSPRSRARATVAPVPVAAVASATLALGAIAAGLLAPDAAHATLQADVVPAATNAAAAAAATAQEWWTTAQGWWTTAHGAGSAAMNGAAAAGNAAAEVFRPAAEQAATLLSNATDYAQRYPAYAAADVAAGTAGAGLAGLIGKGIRWGLGLGLAAAGLAAAGLVEPESARLALDHAYGATADAARQAFDALRGAPSYERAHAEAAAFCSRWGRHALDHLGMTTTFGAAGWAFGPRIVAFPFRLLKGRPRP